MSENGKKANDLCKNILKPEELKEAIKQERDWLNENNAVSAVTEGPVEDLEGIPLPSDMFQGTPPLEKCKK